MLILTSFRACRGIKANRRRVRRNNNKCGYALISPLRSLTLTSVEMMGKIARENRLEKIGAVIEIGRAHV